MKIKFEKIKWDPKGNKYAFLQVPKMLLENEMFEELTSDSILLYSLMLDTVSLSYQNRWVDDEGNIYIIYTVEKAMKQLNRSKSTIIRARNKLESIGLIERTKQGLGDPSIIYVNDFSTAIVEDSDEQEKPDTNPDSSNDRGEEKPEIVEETTEVSKRNHGGVNLTPRKCQTETSEVSDSTLTKNNIIQTKFTKFLLTDLLRARDDAEKVENLVGYVENKIQKQLDLKDRSVCQAIIQAQHDPELIAIAIEDNLFRGSKFKMEPVKKKLEYWRGFNIVTTTDAWNDILDARLDNLLTLAQQKAEEKNPYMTDAERSKFVDAIIENSDADDIRRSRDRAIEQFEAGERRKAVKTIENSEERGLSIMKYLPLEIQEYVKETSAMFYTEDS